ncbi:unnamed protein product [Lepidochelys olivacea]
MFWFWQTTNFILYSVLRSLTLKVDLKGELNNHPIYCICPKVPLTGFLCEDTNKGSTPAIQRSIKLNFVSMLTKPMISVKIVVTMPKERRYGPDTLLGLLGDFNLADFSIRVSQVPGEEIC